MSAGAFDRDRFEAIEAFVLGTMPAGARTRFEEELATDPTLREEVELQRENTIAIELGGVARLLDEVAAEHQEREEHKPAAGGAWKPVLKYAAMITVLLSVAWWWSARPATNERLFAEYHVADPGLPVPMSATDKHAFHDAMVAFKLGDYSEAIGKWRTLLQAEPTNDTLRFYIASATLANGDADTAIPLFQGVVEEPASMFHHKAEWYLFLAYLKAGETEKAKAMSLDDDPTYGERVRAIKAELK